MNTPPKISPIKYWGLWDIPSIHVYYHSDNFAQFSCQHRVTNGNREIVNVHYTFIDRMRGINFTDKVRRRLESFKREMQERNEKIIRLRGKSESMRNLL